MTTTQTILHYFASLPGVKVDWKHDVAADHKVPGLLEKIEEKVEEVIEELLGEEPEAPVQEAPVQEAPVQEESTVSTEETVATAPTTE